MSQETSDAHRRNMQDDIGFAEARMAQAAAETRAARGDTVTEVIDARVAIYGDPTQTFGRIAEVWSGILGHHVNAVDVPLCLMGMKLVRTQVTPDYSDNSDDIEGYLDIFRQLVGEDMVHARLTSEYLEKKAER